MLSLLAALLLPTIVSGRSLVVQQTQLETALSNVKVPVVLGVMSACPDALFCESLFNDVLTQVPDKVELSLSFIGKYVVPRKFSSVMDLHALRFWAE
jgi:hypothetical protein